MPDDMGFDFGHSGPETFAFVLRVRPLHRDGHLVRTIVHVTDVTSSRTSHLTSIEDAFVEIREALKILGEPDGPPDKSH